MVAFLHTRIKTYNNKVKKLYTCWYCIVCIKVQMYVTCQTGSVRLAYIKIINQSGGILANLNNTLPKKPTILQQKRTPHLYSNRNKIYLGLFPCGGRILSSFQVLFIQ